jgi:4-aminobutyrate aminotransferase-like enzyme
MQARGGIRIPSPAFLPLLRRLCDAFGALLVLDEIYTGFGRTGRWFACEHSRTVPDLICLGKALAGGFPISACVGPAELMDAAWPPSAGEAIHTSTFLGHPVGCAMALAQIAELRRHRLPARAARLGRVLATELAAAARRPRRLRTFARCVGLLGGIELRDADGSAAGQEAFRVVERLLRRGYLFLPEGEAGEVVSLTPPLTIGEKALRGAARALGEELAAL